MTYKEYAYRMHFMVQIL